MAKEDTDSLTAAEQARQKQALIEMYQERFFPDREFDAVRRVVLDILVPITHPKHVTPCGGDWPPEERALRKECFLKANLLAMMHCFNLETNPEVLVPEIIHAVVDSISDNRLLKIYEMYLLLQVLQKGLDRPIHPDTQGPLREFVVSMFSEFASSEHSGKYAELLACFDPTPPTEASVPALGDVAE